jgi:glycosyltransferase involved in cell wall biosynthesis
MAPRICRPARRSGTGIAEIRVVTPAAPRRIGFLFRSLDPGGTERQMSELVRRLDPARWQVHVACLRAEGAWLDRVREVAPVTDLNVRSFGRADTVGRARVFAAWCAERRIAVLHTADLPSNIFGQPAAAFARVPLRIANRRELRAGRTVHGLVGQRIGYSFAHRVVANCRAAADYLRAEGVPARKISVIPNGLDIDAYAPRPPITSVRRVATVANLRGEKGHDVLLDAAAIVVRRFPDAHFDLVGGGPERAALEARAAALSIDGAVSFHGHCEDIPARLAAADLFVLPSRSEAFPNAALEAMAIGLPTIASAVGGLLEVIDHPRNGVLVQPGDPQALADQICALMADPTRAVAIGAAGRTRAHEFSFTRMVSAFERIYLTTRAGLLLDGAEDVSATAGAHITAA